MVRSGTPQFLKISSLTHQRLGMYEDEYLPATFTVFLN